jgi:class 3 adenylate cyclase
LKLKPVKLAPVFIAVCVIALVCLVHLLQLDIFDRLERITYDLRLRAALRFPKPAATNLGSVFISDNSIRILNDRTLGFSYGTDWPRHIYGRVLRELSVQGARAVAFDILYGELRQGHDPVPVAGERRRQAAEFLRMIHPGQEPVTYTDQGEELTLLDSDDYFAWQLKRSGRAILAAEQGAQPHALFATNALSIGDISADRDADGVLRHASAVHLYRRWHLAFTQVETNREYGVDLSKAQFEPGKIILPRRDADPIVVPVDADNNFELADFWGDKLPPGTPPKARAFTYERVWHMGIVLAAQALGLDLEHAVFDLEHGTITLRGNNGLQRVIPVDAKGYFYINWELAVRDPRLEQEPIEKLLLQDQMRLAGHDQGLTNPMQNKLVVIGSSATGNNMTDQGATPLEKNTLLVSKHWNVANSIITGRFVRRTSLATDLLLITLLGVATAWLTWQLRVFSAAGGVLLLALAYCGAGFFMYVQYRLWIPLVLPIVGVMLVEHVSLVTYRVVFEQTERRRVKSVFSRIVSPEIVNELLGAEKLSLGGARREVTVLFADVRGFTELTDLAQERAVEYVRQHQLTGDAAEACYDEVAHETLNTVNHYLALVADMVKKHGGTLDKYIGDCVMAFWGAPTANPQHALACVRTAIDAQRVMFESNQKRTEENRQREIENHARVSAGLPPKPMLATLSLGTGINTGAVTVGLMGSEAHILNYTIFGREVNLASRLEHESGRGRIVISETTYEHLRRDDPVLAATCIPLEAVTVKGIRTAVTIYEVPWKLTVPA